MVEISARGASELSAVTDTLAQSEGLFAHAQAAAARGGANDRAPIIDNAPSSGAVE